MNITKPKGIKKTVDKQIFSTQGCGYFSNRSKSYTQTIQRLSTTKSSEGHRSKKGISVTQVNSCKKIDLKMQSRGIISLKHQSAINIQKQKVLKSIGKQQQSQPKQFSQKCVQYKNKKIVEHKIIPIVTPIHKFLIGSKKQQQISTCKNTPRDFQINSSREQCQPFSNRENELNIKQIIQSNIINPCYQKQQKRNPQSQLQKIYFIQNGKKVVTVNSRVSLSEIQSLSVVQHQDWRNDMF